MNAHCILTASSLHPHDRKGREGKGTGKGREEEPFQDQVSYLTLGAAAWVWFA